jgi:aldose 1-epimerase
MNLPKKLRDNLSKVQESWVNFATNESYKFVVLENENICITISTYGLRIVHLFTQNGVNELVDVIVGPEFPEDFLNATNPYYGAIIGPFANRIANGFFKLESSSYQLQCNNDKNHLHGGKEGFHTKAWKLLKQNKGAAVFRHTSTPLHQGYPGIVTIDVTFTLIDNKLKIDYEANSTELTIINLTHHPFFNLNGCGKGSIENHQLQLFTSHYLPINENGIPLGNIENASNSAFDFNISTVISKQINKDEKQLKLGNGFDHCYVLKKNTTEELLLAAEAIGDVSNLKMTIYTTEPGIQFYTGNFMDATNILKDGSKDEPRNAFCLETQHFPNSPNQPQFPSTYLHPENPFFSTTIFKFT